MRARNMFAFQLPPPLFPALCPLLSCAVFPRGCLFPVIFRPTISRIFTTRRTACPHPGSRAGVAQYRDAFFLSTPRRRRLLVLGRAQLVCLVCMPTPPKRALLFSMALWQRFGGCWTGRGRWRRARGLNMRGEGRERPTPAPLMCMDLVLIFAGAGAVARSAALAMAGACGGDVKLKKI